MGVKISVTIESAEFGHTYDDYVCFTLILEIYEVPQLWLCLANRLVITFETSAYCISLFYFYTIY